MRATTSLRMLETADPMQTIGWAKIEEKGLLEFAQLLAQCFGLPNSRRLHIDPTAFLCAFSHPKMWQKVVLISLFSKRRGLVQMDSEHEQSDRSQGIDVMQQN
jgi:hypothetical protein